MMLNTIQTKLENNVYVVTINRPDKLNALNREVFDELNVVLDEIYMNDAIKGVIITGAGDKAFVAGADIAEFLNISPRQGKRMARNGHNTFNRIENCPKPIIAAVNGFALGGGCELAMACHIRIASSISKYGQPEVNLGLIPGYGGTQRLTQLVGKGKALELMMTGDIISAQQALQIGLVNQMVEADLLISQAHKILQKIIQKAPIAIAKVIQSVNDYYKEGVVGFAREIDAFEACVDTEDFKTGVNAFIDKEKALFKGK